MTQDATGRPIQRRDGEAGTFIAYSTSARLARFAHSARRRHAGVAKGFAVATLYFLMNFFTLVPFTSPM